VAAAGARQVGDARDVRRRDAGLRLTPGPFAGR
jgi:hypothetical protein